MRKLRCSEANWTLACPLTAGGQSVSPYLSRPTPKWLSLLSFPQLLPGPIAAPELDGEMSSSLGAPVRPSLPTLGFGPLFVKGGSWMTWP